MKLAIPYMMVQPDFSNSLDQSMLFCSSKRARSSISTVTFLPLEGRYDHLLVAPLELQDKVIAGIEREMQKGPEGYLFFKLNSLTDRRIIEKLRDASCAGVKIHMMVRGICCLVPGIPGETENIEVRSIVGRYLEHSRIYVFGKGSTEKMYIASADFMTRNTRRRVEGGSRLSILYYPLLRLDGNIIIIP